jgi:hypothetical protein
MIKEMMYDWLVHQVQADADTLEGVPKGPHRSRALRRLVMHRRILEVHKPRTDDAGVDVCDACSWLNVGMSVNAYAPCEHLALLAFTYADRPGYHPRWAHGYVWDPVTGETPPPASEATP